MKQQITSFKISIFYSTLYVVDPSNKDNLYYENPDELQAKSFTCVPGNFTFWTFGDCSHALVEVWLADEVSLRLDTPRAIRVPFSVGNSGVSVNSVFTSEEEEVRVPIPEGSYALLVEMKLRDDEAYLSSSWYPGHLDPSLGLRGV